MKSGTPHSGHCSVISPVGCRCPGEWCSSHTLKLGTSKWSDLSELLSSKTLQSQKTKNQVLSNLIWIHFSSADSQEDLHILFLQGSFSRNLTFFLFFCTDLKMSISFENHLLGALKCAQYRDDLLVLGLFALSQSMLRQSTQSWWIVFYPDCPHAVL